MLSSDVSARTSVYSPHGRQLLPFPPVPQHNGVIFIQADRSQTFAIRCGGKIRSIQRRADSCNGCVRKCSCYWWNQQPGGLHLEQQDSDIWGRGRGLRPIKESRRPPSSQTTLWTTHFFVWILCFVFIFVCVCGEKFANLNITIIRSRINKRIRDRKM